MLRRPRHGVQLLTLLLLTSFPFAGAGAPHGHTSVASGGAVERPFSPSAVEREREKAEVRRRLTEGSNGTYIAEMLAERDSALARWPDRHGRPLTVWIQPTADIADWREAYAVGVRNAVLTWDSLGLPVRFAFASDSTKADIHVTFIDHFEEPISGRTKWARDDDWWITNADIVLAVHHRNGGALDDDAMHAMALHELGHLLGLDHTEDPTSIMAPRVRVRELSTADRATVKLLYTLPPGGVR